MSTQEKRGDGGPLAAYGCPRCSKCYVVAGAIVADPILCVCGAALEARPLHRGVYALASSVADDVRATAPGKEVGPPIPDEQDLGYGASHGLKPGHEGPSGPGDAPG